MSAFLFRLAAVAGASSRTGFASRFMSTRYPVWPQEEHQTIDNAYEVFKAGFKAALKNPKDTTGVLLDFDGTIAHTIKAHDESLKLTLTMERTKLEVPLEEVLKLDSKEVLERLNCSPMEALGKFVGPQKGEGVVKSVVETYSKIMDIHYPEKVAFMPNAAEAIAIFSLLRQGGILSYLAIGSFMVHDRLNKAVEKLGIQKEFDVIEGLRGQGKDKDRPEFMERLFPKGKVPNRVLVIGDGAHINHPKKSSSDIVMARNVPGSRGTLIAFGKPCGAEKGYQYEGGNENAAWLPNWKDGNDVIRSATRDAIGESLAGCKSFAKRHSLNELLKGLNSVPRSGRLIE